MTITADDFVNHVLSRMPAATPRREQIAMELRGHISERVNAGEPLDEILEQLGDPVTLAESYLSAIPLVAADWWSRATARLIDFGLPVVLLAPVGLLIWLATPPEWVPPLLLIYVFVGGATIAIYPMVAEARYGKTLGKHLRGLRVVTESGMTISTGQAIVRNLPWLFEVWWIDALFALFTDRSQRAFELLSKTRVVRSRHVGSSTT
jgi:uncharacterized RDD family membrane protein YckC